MIAAADPGKTGAIAWLTDAGELVHVEDMPIIEVKVGTGKRAQVNAAMVARLFMDRRPAHVYLEHVATRPGEGAVGAFSFGRGFGTLEGVLAALGIGHTLVRPDVWKRGMGIPAKADKNHSRQRAMQMFPAHADLFKRVKDDGRSEAAILGSWGVQVSHLGRAA